MGDGRKAPQSTGNVERLPVLFSLGKGETMPIKAFVLIETTVGKTKEVIAALQKMEGVTSVDAVTGPYDIVAVVEQDDLNAVERLVNTKIHRVTGVNRTVSCLSIRVT